MPPKLLTGRVSIESSPQDAEIFVNNIDKELTTPKSIILPSGSHLITLRKKNYSDYTFCCEIIAGLTTEKKVELLKPTTKPAPTGELKIESTPSHSAIYVNLEDTGLLTPETLQLGEGSHLITLKQSPSYDDSVFCVEIVQDELLEKFIELERATGELSITSKPSYANIWLREFKDTESKSTKYLTPETLTLTPTPPNEPITVTLKREGYEDVSFETEIIKGKEIEKHIELLKTEEEAAPTVPVKTGLKITSKPSSAEIYIGEKNTGKITPELMGLSLGEHEITLKKQGYENQTILVTIKEGEILEKFIQLTKIEEEDFKKTGIKIVSYPYYASIYHGEEDTGRITPELLILKPGEHEITLKKEGYEDKTVLVIVEEGKQTEQFVQLTKIQGAAPLGKSALKIVSTPSSASIYIHGENTGRITPELLILDPGAYTITLKKAGYEDRTFFVTIEAEKEIEKHIELEKIEEPTVPENIGELYIISKPRYAKVYADDADTFLITPVLLSLSPGTHNITLKRGGYSDVSFAVTIIKGQKIEKFIDFPEFGNGEAGKRIGQLHIESKPQHAEIWEGGSNLELLTPETLTLTPGTKNITLKKSGFDDYSFTIQIVAGEKSEKLCELTKSTGELFLQSRPSRAKIFIDDKDSHLLTPEKLILAPGTRRIGLSFPAFLDALFIVKIVKGGKIEKFHRFIIPRDSMISEDNLLDSGFFYTKTRCMKCDESPDYDVLFADGNIRAWLCEKHCTELVKEQYEKINAIRRIDNGKATNKFSENSNPNVLSRFIKDAGVVLVQDDEDLAPVYPSGNELGEKITRDEVLQHLKSFYRTKPFVSLIGGICNRNATTGDIDIFIRSAQRDIATEFRIIRMFPEKYWFRFQFHYPYEQESHPGVFTNHMDIYDEKIEAIHNPEIVLMSVPKKVKLFKFFPLLKPTVGKYEKGEEYTIDNLIDVVNAHWDYSKKIASQRKYDGWHVVSMHSKEGKVKIYTEEGNEITDKCPTIVSELKEICEGHDVIAPGELESWEKGKHNPRQKLTSIIHSKGAHEDEETLRLNIFDCLLYDLDIHNEQYSERLKSLDKLKDSDNIKKAETKIVDNEKDLREAVKYFSSQEGSEGAYLKVFNGFPYLLTGETRENLKFKSTFSVDCKVIDIHKVKDADAWNYLCVIEDEKGNEVPIGRTYNTSIKVSKGDILKVEFVNLNQYKTEDGKVWFSWWSPHVIMAREDKTKPDNTRTALKLVIASKGTVSEKPFPKRYENDDAPLTLHQNESVTKGKIVKVNDKIGIVSKIIGADK